ncbi:cytochrome P450 [Mycena pura]|uniref:Cytochrome P450 n=1 Tax=Mycena pura TaxID=153505 RepID=A0AAD6YG83_9AGAR|nr:cytochrome P450 [Mycena pura]
MPLHSLAPSETNLIPAAVLLALINHLYFHRFEPKSANRPLLALAIQPLLLLVASSVPRSFVTLLTISTVFIVTLCGSIALYRISPWHPLAHIPGPTIYKITKLCGVWVTLSGNQHRVIKALHDRYGPFVRTGPNDVSIVHVEAIKTVLGTGGFPKGQYYEARTDPTLSTRNLLTMKGEAHANRRRIWNRGMSSESLGDYETILARRIAQLMERLEGLSASGADAVDIAAWFSFFSFDFMGDMAFGGGFEMLRDGGDKNGLWAILEQGTRNVTAVSHIPWIVSTLYLIPGATRGIKTLRSFGAACARKRIASGSTVRDLWYHLTDEAGMEKTQPTVGEVVADGVLAIIAGSDTTSVALSSFVFFLLSNLDIYRRVQAEVDAVYPHGESLLDTSKHAELHILTACLNETLRLSPPVPTNGPRQVPCGEGRLVAGCFIPEHTQIYIPPYALHRSAAHFYPAPEAFDPDRWLRGGASRPGDVLNTAAFIPFSYGAANCVGKALAWREMLMLTSTLLHTFEVRFAAGFEAAGWAEQLHDAFVTSVGAPLMVELKRR